MVIFKDLFLSTPSVNTITMPIVSLDEPSMTQCAWHNFCPVMHAMHNIFAQKNGAK